MVAQRGDVETASQNLIQGMGRLSAWQKVSCAALIRLSRVMDAEADGSKAAAVAREIRLVLAQLVPASTAAGASEGAGDAVSRVRDQLAERRAKMNG